MVSRVFITIDTELMWRHHVAGHDIATIAQRSLEPAGVGVTWQLEQLNRYGLKACFFVDPMPALVYGLDPVKRVIARILEAGQEVQLHLHPNWTGARADDKGTSYGLFELIDYGIDGQRDLIAQAAALLTEAGAGALNAFRSGSYSANDDTLRALASLGFRYDSSHNGSEHPWPSAIALPPRQIAPIERHGIIEVPVTCIEDRPGHLRHFQICALSATEMRAALSHAARERHAAVTIVGHGFELANRAGTRPNAVHVSRFKSLCRMLAERQGNLVTTHFRDCPELSLDQEDRPLGPSVLRTRFRQAEQLWSNWVEERGA